MRYFLLCIFLTSIVTSVHAVGTKKKRLIIYVRRELVPAAHVTPPAELHRPSENYHELRCCMAGWGYGWKTRPQLFTHGYSPESIDQQVAGILKSPTDISQGTFQAGNLGVYYRRLSNGYEYHIVEGGDVNGEIDALIIAAQLRESGGRRVRATVNGKPIE